MILDVIVEDKVKKTSKNTRKESSEEENDKTCD